MSKITKLRIEVEKYGMYWGNARIGGKNEKEKTNKIKNFLKN